MNPNGNGGVFDSLLKKNSIF